ncbi:hypothetical protein LPJ73_001428 [Coemansia sp. RSA 2703]|nr:hypothetical protein LPJ73_001428 [Coemansia sp. RSA 2703]KAJ2374967.1 hypothetical protein IW150_002810 [Coemansia sp. RSA 2607]KAJ2396832.1 hypothetical protein GGI05_000941 [Coemansia sp. RSA 2603]
MAVTLGFAEPVDAEFGSEVFPSKIGGQPRWLDPRRPLASERAQCDECGRTMTLLVQVYAPEDAPESAFHRTVYVFVCSNGACHRAGASRCMRVFRAQMAESNGVYEEQQPGAADDVEWCIRSEVRPASTCVVCGLAGGKACSRCSKRTYCGRAHQVADWDAGHKAQCGGSQAADSTTHRQRLARLVFPEHVLVTEEEEEGAEVDNGDATDDDASDDEDVEATALVPANGEAAEDSQVEVDAAFLAFQRRMQAEPAQVLRYARTAATPAQREPLFVSDAGRPAPGDVPACERCGAAREFELQVMPQMLNNLALDATDALSIDWGTLLVYTCARSCDIDAADGYALEVVWRQNFSTQGIGEKFVRAMHGDDSGITRQIESLAI